MPQLEKRQEKLELIKLLDEKERRRAEDPLKYAQQHDKQRQATAALESIRALFWGNRVGKTEWGASEVARYVTGKHEYRRIESPIEIWSACPSYDAQEDTTQKKLEKYISKKDIAHIDYLRGRIWKKLLFKNGNFITFKSYEQGREKFQGAGKRLIWFDEEPPKDIWEECFVRVEAGMPLDIILTMTAIKGMTWVYDEIFLNTNNPDLFISEAGWDDNPWLTKEQKEKMSRGLSAIALLTRKHGKFVKRVGLVCAWWDRSKHLRSYGRLDPTWTWYEALDGGYSDPAAWLLIGIDHDGDVHVVRGFRLKGLNAKQIKAERDKRISRQLEIVDGWGDNDDPRLMDDLTELGMPMRPVEKLPNESKSWDETLAMRLEEYGQVNKATGKPRLFISKDLMEVSEITGNEQNWMVQEIENLVWTERKDEVLPKWNDHRRFGHHFDGMRALAYFLISYNKPVSLDDEDEDEKSKPITAGWQSRKW